MRTREELVAMRDCAIALLERSDCDSALELECVADTISWVLGERMSCDVSFPDELGMEVRDAVDSSITDDNREDLKTWLKEQYEAYGSTMTDVEMIDGMDDEELVGELKAAGHESFK